MRKLFGLLVVVVALAVPTMAWAGGGYGSQPGYSVANANTICAGHGAFGAFGDKGDVHHDFGVNNPGADGKPGADGTATGFNNSSLCGNR
ncbi:MAG TPA: hypothetical protein VKB64_05825 [Gaiellaceae bacterium]|nr:hypothetical protein [Gaiellaceae bacterium]